MKRKITILTTALALLAFLTIPMGMWGQTREVETFTFSEMGYENAQDVTTVVGDDVTLTFDAGTNANNSPKYYNTGAGVRMYAGNTLEVALNNQTGDTRITAIEFTFSGNNYTGGLQNWTGSETSHTFTATGTARIQVIAVTFSEGGTAPTTYTVTYYANVAGTAPVVDTYIEGADVTLRDANTFTNDGYTFSEWNTQADGDGDAYEAGEVIEGIEDNIELYAIWTENPVSDEQWVLTNLADLTANDVFVIVGNNGSTYAMSNNNGTSNPPAAVAVTVENEAITSTVAETIQWNISGNANDGYTFYPNGSTTTWLYCYNNNNGLRVGTGDDKTFVMNSNYLYNSGQGRYIGIYQSSNWRSYTSINTNIQGQTFAFYKKVTGGVLPPSISAENVEIAYDATQGSFTFTLNNPVEGGQLDITEDVDWIDEATINTTATGYSVTFITTMNEAGTPREGVITISYTYNTDQTVTKNVTVTQAANPNVVNNISDITEINTQYAVKGMVVAASNKGFIICDGTGFVYTYLNAAPTQQVGDFVQITGTTGSYGHVIQFTNNATIAEAEEFIFDWPDYTVITEVPDYTEGYHLSDYFQFEGALTKSGSNYLVAVGEGQIRISYPTTEQAADLETLLNKTVRIHGFFTGYSGTGSNAVFTAMMESYEEVTSTDPSITIATYTLNVDAEEHEGTINVTYANVDIEMAEVMLCNAEGEPATYDWIQSTLDDNHNIGYNISANEGEARTAYLKVCIYEVYPDVISFSSDIVTVNQAEYVAPSLDYAELPFAFNGGKADIEGTDGLTQNGLGTDYGSAPKLKFDNTGDWLLLHFNEAPGTLTFDIKGNSFSGGTFTVQISEDGETYEDLATYDNFGTSGNELKEDETFSLGENVRYIKWIYTEKGTGNVGLGDITLDEPTAPVPSITFTPDVFNFDAEQHVLQIPFTYENIEVTNYQSFTTHFYDAEGEEIQLVQGEAWYYCSVTGVINGEGYQLTGVVIANEGEARSAYIKVSALDAAGETVYSNLVTVNQAAYVAPIDEQQFALFGGNLVEGDYIIYYEGKAMNNVVSSGRLQYAEIEPEDNVITTEDNAAIVWHIAPNDEGYWTIYSADANAYAASTGVKNKAQMLEDGTDDMAMWTVTEFNGTYEFVNKANAAGDVNANLRNNGTYGFACYSTTTGGALSLYKYTETVATYTLEIAGYGNNVGGYYLIASPVVAVAPNVDNGFLTDAFDLYYFDQAQEGEEWRNYEAEPFYLVAGKGYLYASQEGTTLTFTGAPYNGNGEIVLDQAGWNLIGNPHNTSATVNRDFYRLNADGSELELSETSEVNKMQGIFVEAQNENEVVLFDAGMGTFGDTEMKLNLRVNGNNGSSDFARIRFGEGSTLGKFMFNANNTKLYFTQDSEEFAVVRSSNENEMPVNFKAATNGIYTFSVNAENMEVDYLHLIDNMTGADIDLLDTPSYSFEANTSDYAQRFRLVFATTTGINESADTFAYFNGNEWVISNMGKATLQVVDMTGRILSSETINGCATISTDNLSAGIYMMRLVNGNNVKVQKVVVR